MARSRRDSHTSAVPTGDMVARVRPPRPSKKKPRACYRADGLPKKRFSSARSASTYLRGLVGKRWRRADEPGLHFDVYECRVCGYWHVGRERGWF